MTCLSEEMPDITVSLPALILAQGESGICSVALPSSRDQFGDGFAVTVAAHAKQNPGIARSRSVDSVSAANSRGRVEAQCDGNMVYLDR